MAGIGNSGGGGERIWRERVKMKGENEGGRNFHDCVGVWKI